MERIPKGIYTPEFPAETVKVVEAEGLSIDQAAKRLSVPKSSLSNWVRAARAGKLAEVGKGQRLPSELEVELARTRKELAEVKLERDLLKNVRRISRRSRGEIRPDRGIATPVSRSSHVPRTGRIGKRLSYSAQSTALTVIPPFLAAVRSRAG